MIRMNSAMEAKLLPEQGVRRHAAISAHLRAAPPARSSEILAKYGLTPDLWKASMSAWTESLEEETARGEHELLLAYAEEFRAVERRLTEDPPVFATPEPWQPVEPLALAPTAAPLSPPPPPAVSMPVCMTGPVDLDAILAGRLPFQPSSAPPTVAVPSPLAVKKPQRSSGTLLDRKAPPAPPLPFPGAAPGDNTAPAPELTFEQYVALCSELTVSPSRTNEILAKARVAPAALAALHASWRDRMAGDAQLTGRWRALYAHYVEWFSKSR